MTFKKSSQFKDKGPFDDSRLEELYKQIPSVKDGHATVAVDQNALTPEDFVAHKEIIDEQEICCSNCDRHLLTIIVVDKSVAPSKLKVYCPCGDHSFVYTIIGKAYQDPGEGVQIKDTEYNPDTKLMEVYMQ